MPSWSKEASYRYCERLARRAAGNFYHAFRLLPHDQRRAMCALYAFMRVADDLSDEPETIDEKRRLLRDWRFALHAALAGDYQHPLYPALHDTIERFAIPLVHFEEVLDGVCMDLDVSRYATFPDLYRYCYHVASAVGLCCIHIWGFRGPAQSSAEAAGIALQLTNILRDVGEDASRGRIYLPQEDLARFDGSEAAIAQRLCDDQFRALMHFQAERAYRYYAEALPLVEMLAPSGRAVFLVILRTYRGILDAIVARNFDVFQSRVRLPTWRKLWLVAAALPVRWGLLEGTQPDR